MDLDLDGNVIWIREEENNQIELCDGATFSSAFIKYIKTKKIDLSAKD